MKIADGVYMLELPFQDRVFNPTVFFDGEKAVLVDTGFPSQEQDIESLMKEGGFSFSELEAVILTHQDIDHVGSLPEINNLVDHPIDVYAHHADRAFIEGEKHLMKTDPKKVDAERLESMPEFMKSIYLNPPVSKVTKEIKGGEVLPFLSGVEVIETPGHTPGHVSLYVRDAKVLIAGDAIVANNGVIQRPVPQNTPDYETALESV